MSGLHVYLLNFVMKNERNRKLPAKKWNSFLKKLSISFRIYIYIFYFHATCFWDLFSHLNDSWQALLIAHCLLGIWLPPHFDWSPDPTDPNPFHGEFKNSELTSWENSVCCIYNFDDDISSKLCTCQDSSVVLTCAKLWAELIIIVTSNSNQVIFTKFWLWAHKSLVRWVSGGLVAVHSVTLPSGQLGIRMVASAKSWLSLANITLYIWKYRDVCIFVCLCFLFGDLS